jgi:hypothetical protein
MVISSKRTYEDLSAECKSSKRSAGAACFFGDMP